MRSTAKHIGALVVMVVMATAVPAPVSTVSPAVKLSADSTALILGGTSGPTPDDVYVEIVKNQYIVPTHPGQDIEYVAVTTPEELWPLTGFARLLGLALGDRRIFGPGTTAWPDEPWWKLSGLFDLTADQSLRAGVVDLEAAMAEHPNDHLVIYGLSQGAGVANVEKRNLAEQYPAGTKAPDIDFVVSGDPNLPNGGWVARFPGLYIPILDLTFNGPAATDTQFDTVEINREYDGFADLPLYPLNLVSLLNAVLGIAYVHTNSFDVSLPADPTKSPAYQGKYGDTSYYFFENPDLPLFGPLRTLGVPESLIDVVEPFFKVIVDLGYDRSIKPWEPTPARLFPTLDPAKVAGDLVDAIDEGIDNAAALIGLPPKLSAPAPITLAAPASEAAEADMSPKVSLGSTPTQTQQVTVDTNDDRNPVDDVDGNEDGNGDRTQLVSSTPADPSEMSTTATPAPSTSAATRKPTKPADKLAKPRLSDRSDRGERDHPTTRTAAAGAGATTAAHSATGDSSGDAAGSD